MKVFISHTFDDADQELASTLQKILAEVDIKGYMAVKTKEYDILIHEKVRTEIERSDHMVAIITNNAIKSASVNQEIGYAVREGIKPIIMMEENSKEGVLTYGKDVEWFNRIDFESPCKNVQNFLLKKGERIRISPEERNWVVENVYRPLYNFVGDFDGDRIFVKDKISDPWNLLDNFAKFKMDALLRELFDKLSTEIKKWNGMTVEKEREFTNKQFEIGKVFKECFAKVGLIKDDKMIKLDEHSSQEPRHWVDAFKDVLLYQPNIQDPEDLYRKMIAHAILRDDGHHAWLKRFNMINHKFFKYVFETIPKARGILESELTDVVLLEQKRLIQKIVSELRISLEAKFGLLKF